MSDYDVIVIGSGAGGGTLVRQPLRGRHELLPEHRGRQPGADGDGQRLARRRSPTGPGGSLHS